VKSCEMKWKENDKAPNFTFINLTCKTLYWYLPHPYNCHFLKSIHLYFYFHSLFTINFLINNICATIHLRPFLSLFIHNSPKSALIHNGLRGWQNALRIFPFLPGSPIHIPYYGLFFLFGEGPTTTGFISFNRFWAVASNTK
jgi:hypothetical protein